MKKPTDRLAVKKEDEKYVQKGEIKVDSRGREEVFEVKHNSVTIDWTANITEALSTAKTVMNSVVYSINMSTGLKTLRA